MYFDTPDRKEPVPALLGVAIGICLLGVVDMGLYPAPWVVAAQRVAVAPF